MENALTAKTADAGSGRLDYIDVCKAFGILLVILGHTFGIPDRLYNAIYSFHMPLFFVIAGFVYNKEKNRALGFGKFAAKKAKEYMLPYGVFCLANLAIEVLWRLFYVHKTVDGAYFALKLKAILLCWRKLDLLPNCTPVWFLMALFIASLIFWWIMRIKPKWAWIAALACFAADTIAHRLLITPYRTFSFTFPIFFNAVFYMYVGYCLRRSIDNRRIRKKKKWQTAAETIGMLLLAIVLALLAASGTPTSNAALNWLICAPLPSLISVAVILIFKNCTLLENRFTLWLGRNTLYIIGFNYVCRDVATELYYFVPGIREHPIHWTVSFVLTTALCLACILVCSALRRAFSGSGAKRAEC